MQDRDQNPAILFSYWGDLPAIKIVDTTLFEKIIQQNFRSGIIEILQQGISTEHTRTKGTGTRHVLSAKEIKQQLETRLKMSVKYPGLYFHLSKLEEHKIITTVLQLKEKKNNVSYYGLTAQQFTDDPDWLNQKPEKSSDEDTHDLTHLTEILTKSQGVNHVTLSGAIKELENLNLPKPKGFDSWLKSLSLPNELPQSLILFLLDLYRYREDGIQHIRELIEQLEKE